MNMTIEEIVDNLALFEDWEDRYRYLIDMGSRLPVMDDTLKTETSKVRGCMSQVWMVLGWDGEKKLTMRADSDAQIIKGLIAILYALFQGRTKAEIESVDIEGLFAKMGLDQHLSPNRRNGFFSMVEYIRAFAARG